MRRITLLLAGALVAGCTATSAEFLAEKEGYRVVRGFVIKLDSLHSPEVTNLKDGVAYEATQAGCTIVLEGARGRRTTFALQPGDFFVHARPFSYVLQRE